MSQKALEDKLSLEAKGMISYMGPIVALYGFGFHFVEENKIEIIPTREGVVVYRTEGGD